ncbi:MAG: hypothetical protein JSS11_16645 [Verrucomicrobia bacterium]|nr:hypothetical protein [Verrucomicrobiota bacterium]
MNTLLALWLPILLSAVVVFVISCLVHMVLKWHNSDYNGFANENDVRAAINAGQPAPGRYVIPFCKDMKEMGSADMQQKYREGPLAQITLGPVGAPKIGKFLGLWFVWTLVVSAVAAYLAARVCGFSHPHAAAKLAGAIVFVSLGFGTVSESIWSMRPWSSSVKFLIDAALYGLGAGLVFLYLWP